MMMLDEKNVNGKKCKEGKEFEGGLIDWFGFVVC
jgi:hypothetical protein